MVKSRKKRIEKDRETAMNAGVVAVGADRRFGAFFGRTARSKVPRLATHKTLYHNG
jgi:hypothetical protein